MGSALDTSQGALLAVLACAGGGRLGGDVVMVAAGVRLRERKVVRVGDVAVVDQPADDTGPRTVSVYLFGEGRKFLLYAVTPPADLHLERDPAEWFGVVSMTLLNALAKRDPALRDSLCGAAAPPQ